MYVVADCQIVFLGILIQATPEIVAVFPILIAAPVTHLVLRKMVVSIETSTVSEIFGSVERKNFLTTILYYNYITTDPD